MPWLKIQKNTPTNFQNYDLWHICHLSGSQHQSNLQPVTGVIISSSAVLSNYFKRHFQGTKDVKSFKSQWYGKKKKHSLYIVLKILCFLFITHWITLPVVLQSHWLLMNSYLTPSVPLGLEVFLSFPLRVLPLSASCMHCVNTDFQFSGTSVLYIARSTDFSILEWSLYSDIWV